MARTSAGLILYRISDKKVDVLLVHPGGPFWKHKDLGAWSVPKGQVNDGEDLLDCAKREFFEETGFKPEARGEFLALAPIRQKSGKIVHAWAFEGDCDPSACKSNTMKMEWPARSGKWITVPEVDRAEFFDFPTAKVKILAAQRALIEELEARLGGQTA